MLTSRGLRCAFLAVLTAAAGAPVPIAQDQDQDQDPIALFAPTIPLSGDDRRQVERGEGVVRIVPARDPELAFVAVARLNATASQVVQKVERIAELRTSREVPLVRRFSEPPALADLAPLALDDGELEDLRRCRPGDCRVKLGAEEIATLQGAASAAGSDWKPALQEAFRRLVLGRVVTYRKGGLSALPDYHDHDDPMPRAPEFAAILDRSPYLARHLPGLDTYLREYPGAALPGAASFLYWSVERFGGKPVVAATHVVILRTTGEGVLPEVIVAGKQIFATHYLNAGLSLTAVTRGAGAENYLVYVNRVRVDALGGWLGGVKRAVAERRLRRTALAMFPEMRRRLEAPIEPR